MHVHQAEFVLAVTSVFPQFFHGTQVLEIGSYNVNGSIRQFFTAPKRYVGVDLIAGPDVDVVCRGEDFDDATLFDVAVSTECFEHTAKFLEVFENMTRLVRPGGMVLTSCATTGRGEHGTPRTTPQDSPGTVAMGGEEADYYRVVTKDDFPEIMLEMAFTAWRFYLNPDLCDLYFVGIKFGQKGLRGDLFDAIAARAFVESL